MMKRRLDRNYNARDTRRLSQTARRWRARAKKAEAKLKPTYDRGVLHGFALACSEVQGTLDQPTVIGEVLRNGGITTQAQLREAGVDPFDIRRLRTALREARRRR